MLLPFYLLATAHNKALQPGSFLKPNDPKATMLAAGLRADGQVDRACLEDQWLL
jgi:hypothetical protein